MMEPENRLLEAAMFSPISLKEPNTWIGHIPFSAWLIKNFRPSIFVELGTHSGNSYFSFCQAVQEEGLATKCYAVDTWKGEKHAGFYGEEIFCQVDTHNQKYYAEFSSLMRTTFDEAANYFTENTIDLLHIDGLHTYEAVKHDFETWLPKLSSAAVVMLHDTNVRERDFGVWKFWEELQTQYPNNFEFFHSYGLGVLQLNSVSGDETLDFLPASSICKKELSNYFSALGNGQINRFDLFQLKIQKSDLSKVVEEKGEQVKNFRQLIAERDEKITDLSKMIEDKEGQVDNLEQSIFERDDQIVDLSKAAEEKDGQIENFRRLITERDEQTADLNKMVEEKEAWIETLAQSITERDGHIDELKQKVTAKDADIISIHASTCWRITHPLRVLKNCFKKSYGKFLIKYNQRRFNSAWYLRMNPDVANSGMDAYEHYSSFGKNEGRQPTPDFFIRRNFNRLKLLWQLFPQAIKYKGSFTQICRSILVAFKNGGFQGVRHNLLAFKQTVDRATDTISIDGQIVNRNDYTEWIRRYDTLNEEDRGKICQKIETLNSKPLISVVMPTYNPNPEWLVAAIESVRAQLYPHWELCIADDASTNADIRSILERYAKDDSRIKVVFRTANGHISAASNSAIKLATGEYIALLDHDDLLAEHALFWVAEAINRHPDAQIIYSDEDKIDIHGNRSDPYFKCEWNRDLFYSHNMISHLGVYNLDLIRQLKGFLEGLEGSQDYDLALRCIERIDDKQIIHIPRVLYHWRVHSESTASTSAAKPYAVLAGEKALNKHFVRKGIRGKIEFLGFGYRTRYSLPKCLPLVSLIIPTHNAHYLVKQCIESVLEKTNYSNYEIIIVDNNSDKTESVQYFKSLETHPQIRILRDNQPFNYSALNNSAVKVASGELICLLNNDIEVISPDWLSEMVSLALQPGVGAVGSRLWYPDNTLQHGGVILGVGGIAGHSHKHLLRGQHGYIGRANLLQSLSAVTAACLVIKKSIYEEVGGLNEVNLRVTFNDVDFCLRLLEAGYRNVWTPYAELYHHESATRGDEDSPEKQVRFAKEVHYMQQRWGDRLISDPAYSPNLTLHYEDFSLAWPPRIPAIDK